MARATTTATSSLARRPWTFVIHLEYDPTPDPAVLSWADGLLGTYSARRAIVVTHDLLSGSSTPAPFTTQGQAIYDELKDNANLFLMLGGHLDTEVMRTDVYNGHTVYPLRSDYQTRSNGGNGWLRPVEFQPAANQIQAYTFSPYLNQWETDADSQFALAYDYRAESPDGPKAQINAELIPTNVPPGNPFGAVYEYVDGDVVPGITYTYWLEDVDIYGHTGLHGPVDAQLTVRTMHVGPISLSYRAVGPRSAAIARTTVLDAAGGPVAGAVVSVRWTLPDGSTLDQQGKSRKQGTARVSWTTPPPAVLVCRDADKV